MGTAVKFIGIKVLSQGVKPFTLWILCLQASDCLVKNRGKSGEITHYPSGDIMPGLLPVYQKGDHAQVASAGHTCWFVIKEQALFRQYLQGAGDGEVRFGVRFRYANNGGGTGGINQAGQANGRERVSQAGQIKV